LYGCASLNDGNETALGVCDVTEAPPLAAEVRFFHGEGDRCPRRRRLWKSAPVPSDLSGGTGSGCSPRDSARTHVLHCGGRGAAPRHRKFPAYPIPPAGRRWFFLEIDGISSESEARSGAGSVRPGLIGAEEMVCCVLNAVCDSSVGARGMRETGFEKGKGSILVVDDEESLRLTFELFLKREGYGPVVVAASFEEALSSIDRHDFDLIISDIVLEGASGIEFLRQVRARGFTCPVVMITGYPNVKTASEAVRLGAFDYIPKPVTKDALLRATRRALQDAGCLDDMTVSEQPES